MKYEIEAVHVVQKKVLLS